MTSSVSPAALWNAVNFALETNVRTVMALGVSSTNATAACQIAFNAKRLQLTAGAHVTRCRALAVMTRKKRSYGPAQ